jgi:hypothetical protein
MELAPAFPGGTAGTSRRLFLAGKAAQGVDGAAAGNDACRSGDAYGLRRRITLSALAPECPGDIDRYGERHVGIDPAVRHSNTHGELEQNAEIADGIKRWRRKYGDGKYGDTRYLFTVNFVPLLQWVCYRGITPLVGRWSR